MDESVKAALAKMRVPFEYNQISLLPKPYKKDSPKGNCKECGGYHGLPAVHLKYVGHAALTDRLLDVDPSWSWEPLAVGADGYPVIDRDGGMWIKLTICGVTRYGYGDAQGKSGGDAMKERIGDALRNAAMRFGAALDLWHKGDLHVEEPEEGGKGKGKPAADKQQEVKEPTDARIKLKEALATTFHGNLDEMADALRTYSSFDGKGKDGQPEVKFLTLANLDRPTDNEKMHKWFGSALGKLRKDQEVTEQFNQHRDERLSELKKDMGP